MQHDITATAAAAAAAAAAYSNASVKVASLRDILFNPSTARVIKERDALWDEKLGWGVRVGGGEEFRGSQKHPPEILRENIQKQTKRRLVF